MPSALAIAVTQGLDRLWCRKASASRFSRLCVALSSSRADQAPRAAEVFDSPSVCTSLAERPDISETPGPRRRAGVAAGVPLATAFDWRLLSMSASSPAMEH